MVGTARHVDGQIFHHGHVEFGKQGRHVARTVDDVDGRTQFRARQHGRRGLRIHLFAAPLGAGGKAQRTGRQLPQVFGGREIDGVQGRFGRTQGRQAQAVAHRLAVLRLIKEIVAAVGQHLLECIAVDEVLHRFLQLAARVPHGRIPIPARQRAFDARQRAVERDLVLLQARAQVEQGGRERQGRGAGIVRVAHGQHHGNRVERLRGVVPHARGAVDRQRRAEGLVGARITVQQVDVRLRVRVQFEGGARGRMHALDAGNQGFVGRRVVGQHLPRAIRIDGAVRHQLQRSAHAAEDLRGIAARIIGGYPAQAAALLVAEIRIAHPRHVALLQLVALLRVDREDQAVAVFLQLAEARLQGRALFMLARALRRAAPLRRDVRAREFLVQDDVDDAGHGVGTVDRRGAILEHFDALHGRHRQAVQVNKGFLQVLRRGIAGHPLAIHQDQGIFLADAAQRQARRAGRKAARVLLVVAVAAIGGNRTQHVGHAGLAAGFQFLGGDDLHGAGALFFADADIRSGHVDPQHVLFGVSEAGEGGGDGKTDGEWLEHGFLLLGLPPFSDKKGRAGARGPDRPAGRRRRGVLRTYGMRGRPRIGIHCAMHCMVS